MIKWIKKKKPKPKTPSATDLVYVETKADYLRTHDFKCRGFKIVCIKGGDYYYERCHLCHRSLNVWHKDAKLKTKKEYEKAEDELY